MFDINEKPESDGQKLDPIIKYEYSMYVNWFFTDEQTPMIWRGPMVTSAIKTFTQKVKWKDLDFIIVDMPPGTGDTQLIIFSRNKNGWCNNCFNSSRSSSYWM